MPLREPLDLDAFGLRGRRIDPSAGLMFGGIPAQFYILLGIDGIAVGGNHLRKGAVLLTLKGAGDITVTCCFGEAYKFTANAVKVGSQVDIYGSLQVFDDPNDKSVAMSICVVTEVK